MNSGMFELRERLANQSEIIDGPAPAPEVFEQSYALMEEVNSYYGGNHVIRSFLREENRRGKLTGDPPLRILDLGSGACDLPTAVINWGKKNDLEIEYTCLDNQQAAAERARARGRAGAKLRLVEEDLLAHEPLRSYDYVTASMVMHHFSFEKIRAICRKYISYTDEALVINDLLRSYVLYLLTWLRTTISAPEVRHDALLSVKKGFCEQEFKRLEKKLPGCLVETEKQPLFRLRAVIRERNSK